MRVRPLVLLAGLLISCGGGESVGRLEIALRAHQMPCDIPGLQAKLQIAGQSGDCPLLVNADRTVTGECPSVPTGQVMECRLVYFILLNAVDPPVELATALEELNLVDFTGETAQLAFPSSSLNIDIDDDNDTMSNLAEVCAGGNPRG